MRVGIDVTELARQPLGGVATAIRLLLAALRDHAPDVDLVALAPHPVDLPRGIPMRATGGPGHPRRWRRSRGLARALTALDLFHAPVTAVPVLPGPPRTATVHELPFLVNPRLEGTLRGVAQWVRLSQAMARCAALVAPSEATRRQIGLVHPAGARMTRVVPHPAPPAPPAAQHAHDGSLLFVGRLVRRKCVDALLAGAASGGAPVLLAGPQGDAERLRIEEAARALGMHARLRFLGPVDAATLDGLYAKAMAVGLVSLSEGFGFPVLEALARGVPVIVAKDTGAAEVGGDAVLQVDPLEPDGIAEALRRAADPAYRERIAREGPARCALYTPERTARGYREVFARAVAG